MKDSHLQPSRSERDASSIWANAPLKLVHPAGLPPANSPFEAEDDCNFTTDAKWWVATVLPRALRFKRPLHRCNACNPVRDAKAELNRRSQACDVLAGTGVRVAKNGQSGG